MTTKTTMRRRKRKGRMMRGTMRRFRKRARRHLLPKRHAVTGLGVGWGGGQKVPGWRRM
jgi:hypothetical protein